MIYSLNEIESMAKRAARGAGYPWGISEDAGKNVRWLEAHELPGTKCLVLLIQATDNKTMADITPSLRGDVWQATSSPLCPLISGAALCDRAHLIANGQDIVLSEILQPIMIAPFLAIAAKLTGKTFEMVWENGLMVINKDEAQIDVSPDCHIDQCENLTIRLSDQSIDNPLPYNRIATVENEDWMQMNAYALRTFAPATEESRNSGAGAGLTDND